MGGYNFWLFLLFTFAGLTLLVLGLLRMMLKMGINIKLKIFLQYFHIWGTGKQQLKYVRPLDSYSLILKNHTAKQFSPDCFWCGLG
jgi:hypothetical protein